MERTRTKRRKWKRVFEEARTCKYVKDIMALSGNKGLPSLPTSTYVAKNNLSSQFHWECIILLSLPSLLLLLLLLLCVCTTIEVSTISDWVSGTILFCSSFLACELHLYWIIMYISVLFCISCGSAFDMLAVLLQFR